MFGARPRGSIGFFQKLRLTVSTLASLRRPTIPVALARERYDAMLDTLAKELSAEFSLEWEVDREAELRRGKHRSIYTTRVLRARQYLPEDFLSTPRFHSVQRRVVDVAEPPPGFPTAADLGRSEWPKDWPSEGFPDELDMDAVLYRSVWIVRDREGGDIKAEVDSGIGRLSITATVSNEPA